MAAYVVLNDLLSGDDFFPRAGCAAVFSVWFGHVPAVNAVLQGSIAREPAQGRELSAAVQQAWSALNSDGARNSANPDLMRETLRSVGENPEVRLTYRDPGLPGDGLGDIDVVRIGTRPHTYVMVAGSGRARSRSFMRRR